MATVEQIRAAQEEIIKSFQGQPSSVGSFSGAPQRALANGTLASRGRKPRGEKSRSDLPPPSMEVEDFIVRALGNPAFRRLIERLANE